MARSLFPVFLASMLLGAVGAAMEADVIPMLDPLTLTKFQDPLFIMPAAQPNGTYNGNPLYDIDMAQFQWSFSSQLPTTTVWGYGYKDPGGTVTYSNPGPTIIATTDSPISVRYTNSLYDPITGNGLSHILPIDTTIMGYAMDRQDLTIVHLHGGHNPSIYDGNPWQTFTSDPAHIPLGVSPSGIPGPSGNNVIFTYENKQQATFLWYHDHSYGETHLNPYAGMAAGYVITDAQEASLGLPSRTVPLVIQDKMFTATGKLFYPRGPGDLVTPGGPDPLAGLPASFLGRNSVVPEFFGNVVTVNGTVWPRLDVDPSHYRFRLLDAANSRTFMLQATLADGTILPWHIIGSDGGLLPATAVNSTLTMLPGERWDAILDFEGLVPGTLVTVKNVGPDGPFMNDPMAPPADPNSTGQVMQFRVGQLDPIGAPAGNIPTNPRPITRLDPATAAGTRNITLSEMSDQYGRLMIMINQTPFEAIPTEIVKLGDIEVWNFLNVTPDVHPMHLHDVEFQIIGRQALKPDPNNPGGFLAEVDLTASMLDPAPEEMGWKDTFQSWPGYQNTIIAQFLDYTGDYMYHCHILEHEEFEMMRPFVVVPEPATMVLLALGGLMMLCRRRTA